MTEQEGLFKAFHTGQDEHSLLYDIADTDKIKDLSDEELIERYNSITAMGGEVWRRLDVPAHMLEEVFSRFDNLDPNGTEAVPGRELQEVGLTHGQCAVFYDHILRPFMVEACDRFMKDIRDYENALAYELSKRESLIHSWHETLWYNFGTENEGNDSNWSNMGMLTRRKKND